MNATSSIEVVSVGNDTRFLSACADCQMLVIGQMQHQHLPNFAAKLDEALDGLLSAQAFSGQRAEHALIPVPAGKLGKLRLILIGLGNYLEFTKPPLCAFFGMALDQACANDVERMGLVISTHRLSEKELTLSGSGAILRCRANCALVKSKGENPRRVDLICAPQAKRHLLLGLSTQQQRCYECSHPEL